MAREMNPDDIGKRAVELYDADGDGKIGRDELEKSAALKGASFYIDTNRDGALSADEIAARIRQYQSQSDLVPLSVRVKHKGRPLAGAEVLLEPEPFMGEDLQSYKGVSDSSGDVSLQGESVSIPGLPMGLYRVRITHSTGAEHAELGCEVTEDQAGRNGLVFSL